MGGGNSVDLVINTDVLEHILENEIDSVLAKIFSISNNVFFHLHHALADAVLEDGTNAHCTIKPIFWYYQKISKYVDSQTILKGRENYTTVVLTFPIKWDIYDKYYEIISKPQIILTTCKKSKLKKLLETIFSVKNEWCNNKKIKLVTILGFRLKIKLFS